ncbi:MAG: transketolase [Sulfobacillus thermosulfidooxidans]|nr:MAG: transketolase [Sulfobacillus thermosulfidooxidans]
MNSQNLDLLSVNTIRTLAIDGVQKANSGHPGLPMGTAPMAYVLWTKFLKHNPHNPTWFNRDRFVLSAGHGSMLLYALLHLTGYDLSLDDLKNFRQLGSKTPGHPEYGHTPGVETTTGPLGQGFATAIGMAIAERYLAARYNKPGLPIVDHYTYAIVSDGDLMEGISGESASLAGHLKLGKLIYLYDDNHISIEGTTDIAFSENVLERFQAYGWYTDRVADGNDTEAIEQAILRAQAQDRPSLIAVRTHIGYGSPNKQDKPSAHGSPLGEEEVRLTKEAYGWPVDKTFYIPEEALAHFREAVPQGQEWEAEWNHLFSQYQAEYPDLAREFEQSLKQELPQGLFEHLPTFKDGDMVETRSASGKVINALAPHLPNLIGGSADLAPSNNTHIQEGGDFSAFDPAGRNLHFGVREFTMAAALNGMSLHGGLRVYGGTFLIFSDYAKPAIRLSSLMHQPVIYIFTHDSIGLGEDGPTHQPIEQLAALRAMPNILVIRPADANETAEAWKVALTTHNKPIVLALTRQKVPTVPAAKAEGLTRGGYILEENAAEPDLILIATGSEVGLAQNAYKILAAEGHRVRVVSLPSWELFEAQPQSYKDAVLPPSVTRRIAIEAASTMGWERFVGNDGKIIGMTTFGASGKIEDLMAHFGFTPEHVVEEAHALLARS